MQQIKVIRPDIPVVLEKGAIQPTRGTPQSAGLDLYALEDTVIGEKSTLVRTGVSMAIPEGYVGMIKSRSSMAMKNVYTEAGVIDADFRNDIKVLLYSNNGPFTVKAGDKIAQLLIIPVLMRDTVIVESLNETVRGKGGFGSTDGRKIRDILKNPLDEKVWIEKNTKVTLDTMVYTCETNDRRGYTIQNLLIRLIKENQFKFLNIKYKMFNYGYTHLINFGDYTIADIYPEDSMLHSLLKNKQDISVWKVLDDFYVFYNEFIKFEGELVIEELFNNLDCYMVDRLYAPPGEILPITVLYTQPQEGYLLYTIPQIVENVVIDEPVRPPKVDRIKHTDYFDKSGEFVYKENYSAVYTCKTSCLGLDVYIWEIGTSRFKKNMDYGEFYRLTDNAYLYKPPTVKSILQSWTHIPRIFVKGEVTLDSEVHTTEEEGMTEYKIYNLVKRLVTKEKVTLPLQGNPEIKFFGDLNFCYHTRIEYSNEKIKIWEFDGQSLLEKLPGSVELYRVCHGVYVYRQEYIVPVCPPCKVPNTIPKEYRFSPDYAISVCPPCKVPNTIREYLTNGDFPKTIHINGPITLDSPLFAYEGYEHSICEILESLARDKTPVSISISVRVPFTKVFNDQEVLSMSGFKDTYLHECFTMSDQKIKVWCAGDTIVHAHKFGANSISLDMVNLFDDVYFCKPVV